MRDYGRVTPTFWTRGSGKKLRGNPDAQLVALYLFTCPAATMIGLYHLALPTIAHETGLPIERVREALKAIGAPGIDIARFDEDEEIVYLPGGAKYQIGEQLKPNDKRVKGIRTAVAQFASHPFAADFRARYMVGLEAGAPSVATAAPKSQLGRADDEGPSGGHEEIMEGASDPLPVDGGSPFEARQGKAQDQAQKQASTHTFAGAPAHASPDEDDARPTPCTEDELAELLRAFPVLADLADDPAQVTDLRGTFGMKHGDGATLELATSALSALVGQEDLHDTSVAHRRKRAAKFLEGARRQRSDRGAEPQTPEVRAVLEVFLAAWEAKKKRDFVRAAGDEKHAATIADLARPHAEKLKVRGRVVVKHWAEQYLRDTDKFVADPEHPLRLLASRVTTYGVPRASAAAATPPPPGDAVCGTVVGPPPGFGDSLAGIGRSKGNAPLPRPRFGASS